MILPKPLTYILDSFISDIRLLTDTLWFQNSEFIVSSWSIRVAEQMVCWIKHFFIVAEKISFPKLAVYVLNMIESQTINFMFGICMTW